MKKIIITAFTFFALTTNACLGSSITIDDEFNVSPPYISPVPAVLTPLEKKALELEKKWKAGNLKPMTTEGGRTSFVFGLATPTIVTAPFKVSDLELQAGEVINALVLGDNTRWKADIVFSGGGGQSTSHVIFSALDSGLKTSAVITTDRRVYHINLKSDTKRNMTYVGYIYPQDSINIANQARERLANDKESRTTSEGLDIANLNFNYDIKGKADWKPEGIYDNGIKTYIKLPESMQETPILLVKTSAGDGLVNYRIKNKTLIVDRLFKEAYLIIGVGDAQEKITIKKLGAFPTNKKHKEKTQRKCNKLSIIH